MAVHLGSSLNCLGAVVFLARQIWDPNLENDTHALVLHTRTSKTCPDILETPTQNPKL